MRKDGGSVIRHKRKYIRVARLAFNFFFFCFAICFASAAMCFMATGLRAVCVVPLEESRFEMSSIVDQLVVCGCFIFVYYPDPFVSRFTQTYARFVKPLDWACVRVYICVRTYVCMYVCVCVCVCV